MPYASAEDVRQNVGEQRLADALPSDTDIPEADALLATHTSAASAYINSKISSRYALPLDLSAAAAADEVQILEMLKAATVAIVVHQLGIARSVTGESQDDAYRHWVDWLDQVQEGEASLEGAALATAVSTRASTGRAEYVSTGVKDFDLQIFNPANYRL